MTSGARGGRGARCPTAGWVAALLAMWTGVAVAGPLEDGEDHYYAGRYERALEVLDAGVRGDTLTREEQVSALELMAFSAYLLGRRQEARDHWQHLLALAPEHELNPVDVSPDFIAFFQPTAERGSGEAAPPEAAADEARATSKQGGVAAVQPVPPRVPCAPALCLAPFGVGQIVNQRRGKAAIFGGLEALFLAANVTLYWQRTREYNSNGGFSDVDAAESKLMWQRTFLGLFVATAITGAVDAYVFP